MAHSFSYSVDEGSNWVDLSTYGLMVVKQPLPIMPALKGREYEVAAKDGGELYGKRFKMGTLALKVKVRGTSDSDLAAKIDAINLLLDGRRGDGWIKLDLRTDRFWIGRLWEPISMDPVGVVAGTFTLIFRLSRALKYGSTLNSETTTITTNPQTLYVPADSEEVVGGSADALPTWTIKNTDGSISGGLTFTNVTTGEVWTTSAGIAAGTWVRLDPERGVVEVSTDSGVTWTVDNSIVGASVWMPGLSAGVRNQLTISGLAAGSVICAWRARYM